MIEFLLSKLIFILPFVLIAWGACSQRGLFALVSAVIMVCFSEKTYWYTQGYIEYFVFGLVQFYVFCTLLCLWAIHAFRVRGLAPLFLCASLYGLLVEGVITTVVYGDTPGELFNISYTSLAWHAPLSVVFGWYFLRKGLLAERARGLVIGCILFGVFWGLWSTTHWLPESLDRPDRVAEGFLLGQWPLSDYALYVFLVGIALMAGHWLLGNGVAVADSPEKSTLTVVVNRPFLTLRPSYLFRQGVWCRAFPLRLWELIFALVFLVLWYLHVVAPFVLDELGWLSFLKFLVPMTLAYLALWCNRAYSPEGSLLDDLRGSLKLQRLPIILLMPLLATVMYWLADVLPMPEAIIRQVFKWGAVFAMGYGGFILFFVSLLWCFLPLLSKARRKGVHDLA